MNVLTLIFGALLTENLFFGKLCGSVYGTKSVCVKGAARIGIWMIVVSTISALILSVVEKLVLAPLNAQYLHLILLAAIALLLTQAACCVCREKKPEFLPTFVGCMAVGIAAQIGADVLGSLVKTFFTAVGYLIVLVLMTGVRERLSGSKIPAALKGLPIALITAGLMTLAFMGFIGLA